MVQELTVQLQVMATALLLHKTVQLMYLQDDIILPQVKVLNLQLMMAGRLQVQR